MTNLVQVNDQIINMDQVTLIERKESNHVWIHFINGNSNGPDVTLTEEESIKLWDYLQDQTEDALA